MTKNKIKNGIKLFLLFALVCPLFATAGISEARTYLETLTPDPWITQALIASGKTNVALEHLKNVSGTLATDYAKTILAVSAAGETPATFGNIDYVAKLKTYLNNDQIGDAGLLNDDMWAILALGSVGESTVNEAQKAKAYIIANQNTDGGWGYAKGGESDTNDTAAGIIALREAGVAADNAVITKALAYLKSVQNTDGGFGWSLGSSSDSGSDSWVIIALNKLGISPADLHKDGKNPLIHLQSLQDADGGFWWVPAGSSDFNNKAMTSYAAIALSGKSFPVARYSGASTIESGYHIRIEGGTSTVCNTRAEGAKVLDVIKNAALKCNFTYNIKDTTFGPYLETINGETASGMNGWLYLINLDSPAVGMADYVLKTGDEIAVYFGEWGKIPQSLLTASGSVDTKIGLSVEIESAGPVVAGTALIFTVSPNAIDFGKIKAGTVGKQTLLLKNEGTVDLGLSANVDGDSVFQDYLKLAGSAWRSYSGELMHGNNSSLEVELSVPASFNNSGVKSGDLIIWATSK